MSYKKIPCLHPTLPIQGEHHLSLELNLQLFDKKAELVSTKCDTIQTLKYVTIKNLMFIGKRYLCFTFHHF